MLQDFKSVSDHFSHLNSHFKVKKWLQLFLRTYYILQYIILQIWLDYTSMAKNFSSHQLFDLVTLRKKCPFSELFLSAFFPHFPAFGLNTERYFISSVFRLNAGKCGKKADQNNSEYRHFLNSVIFTTDFQFRS